MSAAMLIPIFLKASESTMGREFSFLKDERPLTLLPFDVDLGSLSFLTRDLLRV